MDFKYEPRIVGFYARFRIIHFSSIFTLWKKMACVSSLESFPSMRLNGKTTITTPKRTKSFCNDRVKIDVWTFASVQSDEYQLYVFVMSFFSEFHYFEIFIVRWNFCPEKFEHRNHAFTDRNFNNKWKKTCIRHWWQIDIFLLFKWNVLLRAM